MPVQNYYTSHKFQDNSKTPVHGKTEIFGMKPSATVVRNLIAYAAALTVFKTINIGDLYVLMN